MSEHDLLSISCTAFQGPNMIAAGPLCEVALKAREAREADPNQGILIFNDITAEQIEVNYRGTEKEFLQRLGRTTSRGTTVEEKPGPGRPKLGVVAREVTLLPRHWEWLAAQPGGASVTLRKLVEEARRQNSGRDLRRQAQETTYWFLSVVAGDLPNFEEASRALYADDTEKLESIMRDWPADIRAFAKRLYA